MPAFSFEALDDQGLTRKGVVEADTAKAARGQLRAQALVPLAVELVGDQASTGAGVTGRSLFTRPVFGATALAIWTRQLAGLVSSGLPLERALTALSEEAENERQRHLVAVLRAEVNAGSTFARALQQHPREFSDIYCAVIGAGEHSGKLGLVLERLADDLEERQALKAQLVGRLGHTFREPRLLEEALTHRSYHNERKARAPRHNERLEFLGDAILGAAVTALLYEGLPDVREGELTRRRAELVCEAGLHAVADELCRRAGIDPNAVAARVDATKIEALHAAMVASNAALPPPPDLAMPPPPDMALPPSDL